MIKTKTRDFSAMTVVDLKKLAKKHDIVIGKKNRAELITAIRRKLGKKSSKKQSQKSSKKIATRTYLTHNNEARPYKVVITDKYIRISKTDTPYKEINYKIPAYKAIGYNKYILTIPNYLEVFIGKSQDTKYSYDGNTILVRINKNKYMYIGETIYEFSLKNDEILSYNSPVGNNDVPYPYAVGKYNTYLMLDKVYISNSFLNKSMDPYMQFYNENKPASFLAKLFMIKPTIKLYNYFDVKVLD